MAVVYYLIAVMVAVYGIKCIFMQQGKLIEPSPRMGRGRLVSVTGPPAVTTGLGYLCGSVF